MSEGVPENKRESKRDRLVRFLTQHPAIVVIGFLGGVASIVALPLSWWMFKAAEKKPNLTYYVNPNVTTVLKAGELGDFNVDFKGMKITNDLSAVQIAIWNAGNQPIERDDILKEIKIRPSANLQFVGVKITKTSRMETQFSLVQTNMAFGIPLYWRILEPNDGAVIQIVYTGDSSVKFSLEGTVKEQRALTEFQDRKGARIPRTVGIVWGSFVIFFLLVFSVCSANKLYGIASMAFCIEVVLIGVPFVYLGTKALLLAGRDVPFGF